MALSANKKSFPQENPLEKYLDKINYSTRNRHILLNTLNKTFLKLPSKPSNPSLTIKAKKRPSAVPYSNDIPSKTTRTPSKLKGESVKPRRSVKTTSKPSKTDPLSKRPLDIKTFYSPKFSLFKSDSKEESVQNRTIVKDQLKESDDNNPTARASSHTEKLVTEGNLKTCKTIRKSHLFINSTDIDFLRDHKTIELPKTTRELFARAKTARLTANTTSERTPRGSTRLCSTSIQETSSTQVTDPQSKPLHRSPAAILSPKAHNSILPIQNNFLTSKRALRFLFPVPVSNVSVLKRSSSVEIRKKIDQRIPTLKLPLAQKNLFDLKANDKQPPKAETRKLSNVSFDPQALKSSIIMMEKISKLKKLNFPREKPASKNIKRRMTAPSSKVMSEYSSPRSYNQPNQNSRFDTPQRRPTQKERKTAFMSKSTSFADSNFNGSKHFEKLNKKNVAVEMTKSVRLKKAVNDNNNKTQPNRKKSESLNPTSRRRTYDPKKIRPATSEANHHLRSKSETIHIQKSKAEDLKLQGIDIIKEEPSNDILDHIEDELKDWYTQSVSSDYPDRDSMKMMLDVSIRGILNQCKKQANVILTGPNSQDFSYEQTKYDTDPDLNAKNPQSQEASDESHTECSQTPGYQEGMPNRLLSKQGPSGGREISISVAEKDFNPLSLVTIYSTPSNANLAHGFSQLEEIKEFPSPFYSNFYRGGGGGRGFEYHSKITRSRSEPQISRDNCPDSITEYCEAESYDVIGVIHNSP